MKTLNEDFKRWVNYDENSPAASLTESKQRWADQKKKLQNPFVLDNRTCFTEYRIHNGSINNPFVCTTEPKTKKLKHHTNITEQVANLIERSTNLTVLSTNLIERRTNMTERQVNMTVFQVKRAERSANITELRANLTEL